MARKQITPTIFDNIDFPDYSFVEYPKVLYAPDGGPLGYKTVQVESPSDERSLGSGWFTTPGEALKAPSVPLTLSKVGTVSASSN